jgi:hypothetical protein
MEILYVGGDHFVVVAIVAVEVIRLEWGLGLGPGCGGHEKKHAQGNQWKRPECADGEASDHEESPFRKSLRNPASREGSSRRSPDAVGNCITNHGLLKRFISCLIFGECEGRIVSPQIQTSPLIRRMTWIFTDDSCRTMDRCSARIQTVSAKDSVHGSRGRAAEDGQQILAAVRLRHEFPAASGFGVAREGGGEQGRWVEFGFHDFGQEFDGLLDAADTSVFFFYAADEMVELFAGGGSEGAEEFLETHGATERAGEERVEWHDTKWLLTQFRAIFSFIALAGQRWYLKPPELFAHDH